MRWTEREIQKQLFKRFNHKYVFLNMYVLNDSEQDWLSFLESGYNWEIECKCSRTDYLKDFSSKPGKHNLMASRAFRNAEDGPNRFYFACPKDVIEISEVPEYAGLICVEEWRVTIVKKAPLLHRKKLNVKEKIFDKIYYQYERIMRKRVFKHP